MPYLTIHRCQVLRGANCSWRHRTGARAWFCSRLAERWCGKLSALSGFSHIICIYIIYYVYIYIYYIYLCLITYIYIYTKGLGLVYSVNLWVRDPWSWGETAIETTSGSYHWRTTWGIWLTPSISGCTSRYSSEVHHGSPWNPFGVPWLWGCFPFHATFDGISVAESVAKPRIRRMLIKSSWCF